ncbi:MAG TPA: acyl-CoA dehydrogenase family protein [Ilumatobacteraceae bacterium]|nr:acyl-CoA dehydrogenase family protein [Ilumatobacteraceae bacterium]
MNDILEELDAWLADNWDPDLTVGEWWQRLGLSGWSAPALPTNAYGKGLGRNEAIAVANRIQKFGAVPAPGGLGMLLAAPTIAVHGTQEQIDRYVKPIVTGEAAWCQLFSEPGAGSDLAGLGARAIKDGDEWIVNGQKVWTSGGHIADMGMLIARTNPDVPKHQGITWFACDMHQGSAVEIRPLREMTGRALFNEVFLSDARVEDAAVIGGLHNGWAVANTTLMFERAGLGAGGHAAAANCSPGTVAGDLPKRVGDFVRDAGPSAAGGTMAAGAEKVFISMARANGKLADHTIRQDIVRLHTMHEVGRMLALRLKAEKAAGRDIPGAPNIAKLSMSNIMRASRDLGLKIAGANGMLHGYTADARAVVTEATGLPVLPHVTELALFAQGPPIYGGTDQVQRNILGERALGLPKEPNEDKVKTWAELPRNG